MGRLDLRRNALLERTQLGFRSRKQSKPAIETDQNLRENPDNGLVKAFQAGIVDVHLRPELCLFFRPTRFTRHDHFTLPPDLP